MVSGSISSGGAGPGRGISRDGITQQKITPGTTRRILPYVRPYKLWMSFLLAVTVVDALVTVASPLLFKVIIDDGIMKARLPVVIYCAVAIGALAIVDAVALYGQGWWSGRIGEGLVYDLRTKVFSHVQRQPIAFFTRAQTGSLVSRLNTDVIAAQQSVTTLLSSVIGAALSLALVIVAMFYLSWEITIVALVLLPLFVFPGKVIGRRLQRLARESMQLNADMGSIMQERFNVAGAMLAKLYGRPKEEDSLFAGRAARVRDVGVLTSVSGRMLMIVTGLIAALATALVYGLGGSLVIKGAIDLGSLVALASLLGRLYGPINQLSNTQVNVMTALVSFDRVFEVLDLKPLVSERPGAIALPRPRDGAAPVIEFDQVSFRYPAATEVSLASLEAPGLPAAERSSRTEDVLHDVKFVAPAGQLTALVGPSGAGKTTITHLVARLYDPGTGTVRIDGHDMRDLTLDSMHSTVGVVTQDAHMYHDTIRANLRYARPDVTEQEMIEACEAAQIWELISALPQGLDTVVGDRGYRLSGGEKQRVAIARLLIKEPSVVILDEATAHLDSDSEAAVQRALKHALAGRTSLVIAHRLSTIRDADQILVVDCGEVAERGKHDELLAAGGLYADLYHTQFRRRGQPSEPGEPVPAGNGGPDGQRGHSSSALGVPGHAHGSSAGPPPWMRPTGGAPGHAHGGA